LIHRRLREGKVIPFLGAGVSFGTRNPSKTRWRRLNKMVSLPTAGELATYLAGESKFPESNSTELAKVAQYYEAFVGRKSLDDELNEIFTFDQAPASIHEYLADAAKYAPQLIVTTNYDDLTERAFTAAGQPYDVVIHMSKSSETGRIIWREHGKAPRELKSKDLVVDASSASVIYKIHGAIDRDDARKFAHYVITEDDYVEFLTRMAIPKILVQEFQKRHFLFIGYGLQDWNVRVVLNRITSLRGPGALKSWAIEARPKPVDKTLWRARDVIVYDSTSIDEFVKGLRAADPARRRKPRGRT
jgi:hypothetical protein